MPDKPTDDKPQDTPDEAANNTGGQVAGAATPPPKPEADKPTDITQTAEFKAALTSAIEKKIPQLRKQIAKEVTGEKEGQPTAEELQQRAEAAENRLKVFEAREQVEDYVSDKRNNVSAKNVKALFRYIRNDFQFDDEGKVTNLKELVTQAKSEAPELFQTAAGSADGGKGAQQGAQFDMNTQIRRQAGYAS